MVGGERGQSPFKIGAKGRGGVTRKAGPAQSLPTWRLPKGRQMEPVTRRTRETCSGRAWGPGKLAWRAASPSLLMTVLPPAAAQIGTSGRGAFLRGRPSATGKAVRLHRVPDLSPCSVLPYPHFHANKLRSGLRSLPKATVTWVHIATRPVQAGPTAPSPGPLGLMRKLDWASVSLEGKASVSPHQEMEGSRPPR